METLTRSAADAAVSPWLPGHAPTPGRVARARCLTEADRREIARWPLESLLPATTILGCLRAAADMLPDKTAIIQLHRGIPGGPRSGLSYGDLLDRVERAGRVFQAHAGPGRRPVVGVVLPMVAEGLIASWAAMAVGTLLPVNPYLEVEALAAILRAGGVTTLVTTTPAAGGDGVWRDLDRLRAMLPDLQHILLVGEADPACGFDAALAAVGTDIPLAGLTAPEDVVVTMPTGGTTGLPKLVRMSQQGLLTVSWNTGVLMGPEPDFVVAHGMPNFHCGGLIPLATRSLLFGQTLLTLTPLGFRDREVVANFWPLMQEFGVNSVLSTPTTAAAILQASPDGEVPHRITDYHCGGSTIPVDLMERFHRRFGVWLRENWGLTEMHGTITGHLDPSRRPQVGSVGRALPGYTLRVVELDDHSRIVRDLPADACGVVIAQGPTLMLGYNTPDRDPEFFVTDPRDGTVWGNSGDIGRLDADGYLWLSGRAKDLIIRGGHNIDPRLIEDVLDAHPAVRLCAAVAEPDAEKGEMPVAYVELMDGAEISGAALRAWCAERIAERAALPREIRILEALPLTPVGKISKVALRLDAKRCALETALRDRFGAAAPAFELSAGPRGDQAEFAGPVPGNVGPEIAGIAARLQCQTNIDPAS
ncbi:AMP-binding protein [Paracoccus sp. DMF]|uniref:AMP-binding protein n=1 Tax=Paracoccus sp. DMF TaxID=400837 RepID=UPI0021E41BB4|nr:AMP-binding protein [Paracoccus sp. DMF]MCV2449181.1 AMP-binding protein [Paracoccus sp. DMF]